mmetsp:Transcript_6113/g.21695  ORF Transcript_6113/g.21695 Transcript_6113/m.21695 type:complete len:199 (-) Transcript_6113:881-1477(-)
MPPKKAEKKAADDPDGDPGMSPANLLSNYQKVCRSSAVAINQKVVETLTNEDQLEVFLKTSQLVVDDEHGPLGATGTRALCSAILGLGQGLSGAPCKLVKSLRIWRGGAGDDGAACLAELLRLGGAEVPISYLELLDNNVGRLLRPSETVLPETNTKRGPGTALWAVKRPAGASPVDIPPCRPAGRARLGFGAGERSE